MANPSAKQIDHWCRRCGTHFTSVHPRHLYCEPCSESQDLKRKRLSGTKASYLKQRSKKLDVGLKISADHQMKLHETVRPVELQWLVRICVPFSWSGSKNAIYVRRRKGHVALRREASDYRTALILSLQAALQGRKIKQNKLWIDIFVEKSNHKGDAANFVDTVCDAVKVATGLDDRWFAIRHLDWSINKDEPQLFVGVGQEKVEDAQICSYCGRIQELNNFSNNRHTKIGKGRICRDCSKKPIVVTPLDT